MSAISHQADQTQSGTLLFHQDLRFSIRPTLGKRLSHIVPRETINVNVEAEAGGDWRLERLPEAGSEKDLAGNYRGCQPDMLVTSLTGLQQTFYIPLLIITGSPPSD